MGPWLDREVDGIGGSDSADLGCAEGEAGYKPLGSASQRDLRRRLLLAVYCIVECCSIAVHVHSDLKAVMVSVHLSSPTSLNAYAPD